jgi:CBS domain-containing protein
MQGGEENMPLSVHVWDFASRDFKTIQPNATLGEAMEVLSEKRETGARRQSLVVVNRKGEYVGVISMRNILNAFKSEFHTWVDLLGQDGWEDALQKGLKKCNYRLIEDYLVKVPTLKMSDDLMKAFKILTEKNLVVRAIPVIEADRVEAVVRVPDLFGAFVEAYRKVGE